jgi:3'(2'), 5'-bisphosphate nucleotidase
MGMLLLAAIAGGRVLLDAPRGRIETKTDGSPVTFADLMSERAITAKLSQSWPAMPVVSEEGAKSLPEGGADTFLLVDPLDGTREFMAGRDDFAVCIAIIECGRPAAGVILAPERRRAWLADGLAIELPLDDALIPVPERGRVLKAGRESVEGNHRIVVSRSHGDPAAATVCDGFRGWQIDDLGSAIKFAAVARGDASLYPRGAGSMEWDTAAGDALVHAAGGVLRTVEGALKIYGKTEEGFRNGAFIAARDSAVFARALAQWPPN